MNSSNGVLVLILKLRIEILSSLEFILTSVISNSRNIHIAAINWGSAAAHEHENNLTETPLVTPQKQKLVHINFHMCTSEESLCFILLRNFLLYSA